MNLNEKLFKKLPSLQGIPSTSLQEIQNSPIKILKSYLEEQKLQKILSENELPLPITMLNKKPSRQNSLKFMISGRQSPHKSMQDYPLQTKSLKRSQNPFEAKNISDLSSLSNHSAMETLSQNISLKRKELCRNYSSEKVTAKLSLYYRKLTRIRSQYQQELIKKCRRLPKLGKFKEIE